VLRDVLGKLVMETKLLTFLERLLGEPVAATDTITVSSTQRARIVAWLNDNSIPASFSKLKSNLIRVPELLSGAAFAEKQQTDAPAPQAAAAPAPSGPVATGGAAVLGIGIDIQARSSMPEAADYRSDRFYSANFSPGELAHCIQQGDPLLSLAGIWAAKEAIIKAGAGARDKADGLAGVEIAHAADGSPRYGGCLISISHDHGVAVAVCVRLA
jgi:phosphopantetheine--protein transferase-like protein